MSDWCGTACALQQHPAAHDMPAHCEVGDGHPAACLPALHGCSARLLRFLPLCFPSPPHGGGGGGRRRRRREGKGAAMCLQNNQHTNVCTKCRVGDAAGRGTHTHTCSWRASLLPHHSTKKGCGDRHGESVWWWSWYGHWRACMVWWPWSAAQLLSMVSTCAMPPQE